MTVDFDFQPTLQGARVIVRPIASSDWESMFAAAADPEIWVQHPSSDRYTERAFRQYFDDAIECGSAFAFVDRQSGTIIGSSRYHGFDPVTREVEIGWTFLEEKNLYCVGFIYSTRFGWLQGIRRISKEVVKHVVNKDL